MSGIEVKINDRSLNNMLRGMTKYSKDVQNGVSRETHKSLSHIESSAKTIAPVLTGRLRASIKRSKLGKFSGKVATDVVYAVDVENGHPNRTVQVPAHSRITKTGKRVRVRAHTMRQRKRSGRFFMKRSADKEFPRLMRKIIKLIEK